MKSTEFLQAAIDVQAERGKQYDSPEGERSMGRTVQAFNAITGRDLSEAEGWLLLQVLKDVRQWQNPASYHHDSALDGVAYSALKAEALSGTAEKPVPMPKVSRERSERLTRGTREGFVEGLKPIGAGVVSSQGTCVEWEAENDDAQMWAATALKKQYEVQLHGFEGWWRFHAFEAPNRFFARRVR